MVTAAYLYLRFPDLPEGKMTKLRAEIVCEQSLREVAEKLSRLRLAKGLSVRTALVYAGELSPAVREEGFFDFIVGADELFADA